MIVPACSHNISAIGATTLSSQSDPQESESHTNAVVDSEARLDESATGHVPNDLEE